MIKYFSIFKKPLLLIIIAMGVAIYLINPNFISGDNISNFSRQVAILSFVSCGMAFAVISGGIDLSVGSIMSCVSVVVATCMKTGTNYILAIILGIAVGTVLGLINAVIINTTDIPPFVATLGTMVTYGGVAYLYTDGIQVMGLSKEFMNLASGYWFGIPLLAYFAAIAFVVSHILLESTKYGLRIRALGGKTDKIDAIGIRPKNITYIVYGYSGLMAAMAGILLTSRVLVGMPTIGVGYNLQAIATTTVGGVLLGGGYGSIPSVLQGVVLTGLISNGLNLVKVTTFWQYVATGIIIIVALAVNAMNKKGITSK